MDNEFNFDDFAKEAEAEAEKEPEEQRKLQLERIRALWERYKGDDAVVSFPEIVALMETEEKTKSLTTSWGGLNKIIDGFRYEQLVIISAAEKSGKTTWAIDLLSGMPEENPCYFLFEQSAQEIVTQRQERGQSIPFGFAPKRNIDNKWEWVEKRMLEAMVKHGSRVFVIDNVDWLQKEYGFNQRTDEVITDLLLKMKTFCKTWRVVIFLIAHVKKLKMDEIPQPDDIKNTSAFKQIADLVLILWRKTQTEKVEGTKTKALYKTNETLLWVAENRRNGKTGYVQLIFDGKIFTEKVWDEGLKATESFSYHDDSF